MRCRPFYVHITTERASDPVRHMSLPDRLCLLCPELGRVVMFRNSHPPKAPPPRPVPPPPPPPPALSEVELETAIRFLRRAVTQGATESIESLHRAIVMIEMERSNTPMQHRFERLMNAQPRVMSCYEVSGDVDFMLLVSAKNMSDYHEFTRNMFTYENNVRNFKSQFVMNFTKSGTKIALD